MSNTILSDLERKTIKELINVLSSCGSVQLSERLARVFKNADMGLLTRDQFMNSIVRDAAFRGIYYAWRVKNGTMVKAFSELL